MSFLQPLFLAGLLAAALPIIIHLINRRKAVRRPFPALRLLRRSHERIARSIKIRQWVLLALRVLAIAVLAFALAKPFVLSSEGMTDAERLPTAVAVVVENGLAMDQNDWWDEAREVLDDELDDLRTWDEVALLTTADDERLQVGLSSEHGDVRDGISELEPSYRLGDLGAALLEADDLVAASELPNRRIIVIGSDTDVGVETQREISLNSPVDYVSVRSEDGPVDNIAIVDFDYEQTTTGRQGEWSFEVVVENFGELDSDEMRLNLEIGDDVVGAASVAVPAGESRVYSFEHRLEGGDIVDGVVELEGAGGIEADTRWHFHIEPRHRVRTLLVNGSPSSVPYDDELFFLTRALEPGAESEVGIVPSVTTPQGLERHNLDDFDVVVMANVSGVSADEADQLKRFVERGGGLMFTMGDQIDEQSYNQQFGDLLPRPLRGKKKLAEIDDPDAPVKTTRLGRPSSRHPIFSGFDAPGSGSLQNVSVYSYMLLDPVPSDREAESLLSFQNNAPALLERRVGHGRVLLFTSTIDRDWTDLPVRSAYVPMVNRSLLHLARRASFETDDVYYVGEPVRMDVDDVVRSQAIIRDPEGRRMVLEPAGGEVVFTPEQPGTYSFFADEDGDGDETSGQLVQALTVSANVDRDGSDLNVFPHHVLDEWEGDYEQGELISGAGDERRVNLWSIFLFVVVLALLVETVLGVRRSVLIRTWQTMAFWQSDDEMEPG